MKLLRNALIIALLSIGGGAQASIWQWSQTASVNATADPTINWAEGMSPSSVNDSARAMMSQIAKWRDDFSGLQTTTGTSVAYLLTSNQGNIASVPQNGQMLAFRLNLTNGVAPTLLVDGGTAYPIQTAPGSAVPSGAMIAGTPYAASFNSSALAWVLHGFYSTPIAAGSIVTSMIGDKQVTYAKIQDVTAANRLLGRWSSGAGVVQEVTVSSGLNLNTATGALTSAFAPSGSFKNLSIKVTGNTTIAVAADFVTTTNGTSFQTTPVSCTINMATTGANALDTGSIATSTWYAVWIIVKDDATTGCLGSLQFSANGTFTGNLPSTYTYYARVGAVRTASGVAQLLGTWQFGRRAQYVVGLAQTTTVPNIAGGIGAVGTYDVTTPTYAAQSVSAVVPPTASEIDITYTNAYGAAATRSMLAAPSAVYAGPLSNTPPPVSAVSSVISTGRVTWVLESTDVYLATSGAGGAISCPGWTDNI